MHLVKTDVLGGHDPYSLSKSCSEFIRPMYKFEQKKY